MCRKKTRNCVDPALFYLKLSLKSTGKHPSGKKEIPIKTLLIMARQRTLAILKPDCVRKGLIGEVLRRIQDAGFTVKAMKMTRLTKQTAGGFYAVHKERPFFDELTDFMSSGPCVPVVLEKENAIEDFRALIGATNPAEAAEGTVRKEFADSVGENIVHGSDSVENGKIEAAYFFAESELVANES